MSLDGKVIAFTGTLTQKRADATEQAEAAGATVSKTVTKKTDILVTGEGVGAAKITAAQNKGVEVWDEDQFNAACKGGGAGSKRKPAAKSKKAPVKKAKKAAAADVDMSASDEEEEDQKPAKKAATRKKAPPRRGKKAAAADDEEDEEEEEEEQKKPKRSTRKAPAKRGRKAAADDDEEEEEEEDSDDGKKKKKKAAPTKKKTGLGGAAAPTLQAGAPTVTGADVDDGLQRADPKLYKVASIYKNYECKLSQINPAQNTDKYYILQLLVDGANGGYHVYTRWGRTGTAGQNLVNGVFNDPDDAIAEFEKKYHDKTGVTWDKQNVGGPAKKGKYRHLAGNKASRGANAGGSWQYYLTNDPLGKPDGWYDYDAAASGEVEEVYLDMKDNQDMDVRYVTADNGYTYAVDLNNGTQTNTTSNTQRPIRRVVGGAPSSMGAGSHTPAAAVSSSKSVKRTAAVQPSSGAFVVPKAAARAKITAKATKAKPKPKPKASAGASSGGGSGAVDKHAPAHIQSGSVVAPYDCMLNQTNIVNANNNKFIKAQVVNAGGKFYLWKRWGRVGAVGQSMAVGPKDQAGAIKEFTKYFRSKTANDWDKRDNFVKANGKYMLVEIENDDDAAQKQAAAAAAAGDEEEDVAILPCQLDKPTMDFVKMIFDADMFKSAMTHMKLDPKKLPLGALSQKQLDKGEKALEDLEEAIKQKKGAATIGNLTAMFYTIIPHSFGMSKPPIINTLEEVKAKFDMINTLRDIDTANQMAEGGKGLRVGDAKPHPCDINYEQLNADLTLVNKSDPDYNIVNTYLQNTSKDPAGGFLSSGGHNKLRALWRVDRHDEQKRFEAEHGDKDNRHLLWHGTSVAVVAAILKSGLRIMPHSGGRVGRGIYLADCQAKSAAYTRPHGRSGVMFLVEAPLGKEHFVWQDGAPSSYTSAPPGFDCVVARGQVAPDPTWPGGPGIAPTQNGVAAELVFDGKPVRVPQGTMGQTDFQSKSSFRHNEILVYKESQHRIRYVLLIDW